MEEKEIKGKISELNGWELVAGKKIKKEFNFEDFKKAVIFVNGVALLAEKAAHHPDIHIFYNKVVIELWTHSENGLTEKDFHLASDIEKSVN